MSSSSILIVDDHLLLAEAMRNALAAAGLDVVGVETTGADAIEAAERHSPALVVMDLRLPDMSGLDAGRKILEIRPGTKILAMSAIDDPQAIAEGAQIGFEGYLSKDTPLPGLVSAIRDALSGRRQAAGPPRRGRPGREPENRHAALLARQLTPREVEVLALLVDGTGGGEIARRLNVSPNTVRTHVQSILMKLQVHSRLEAASFALRHGIIARAEARPERPIRRQRSG